jgi:hypothetical protein
MPTPTPTLSFLVVPLPIAMDPLRFMMVPMGVLLPPSIVINERAFPLVGYGLSPEDLFHAKGELLIVLSFVLNIGCMDMDGLLVLCLFAPTGILGVCSPAAGWRPYPLAIVQHMSIVIQVLIFPKNIGPRTVFGTSFCIRRFSTTQLPHSYL